MGFSTASMGSGLVAAHQARLQHAQCLTGAPWTMTALTGGLTNVNYDLRSPQYRYVARLSSPNGDLLAIDRDAEYANSTRAAQAGVAPKVVEYLPEQRVLIIDWVDGRTWSAEDLTSPAALNKAADAIRQLHGAQPFEGTFDMFALRRTYLDIVREHGFRLPMGYLDFDQHLGDMATALSVAPEPLVPCHNDLLAANFIEGERLWIIDYEYSGLNDPCFELGNLAAESDLDTDALTHLITAYYGRPRPDRVARALLLGLLSRYGWTLWAAIQDGVGEADFDYWDWGMHKYERAVADFRSPSFREWLKEAATPT